MDENTCGKCLLYSYISYISCFCCMAIKDIVKECYKKWKNTTNTNGFNKYEIIPKNDENRIGTYQNDDQLNTTETYIDFEREPVRTINLNNSTSTILNNWTIRPNVIEEMNDNSPI